MWHHNSAKTHTMCEWVAAACVLYPESKGLIVRSTRRSLTDSVLPILEKVWGPTHPMVRTGGSRSQRWHYHAPGFGEVVLGGMDNPTKLYSTEYDWVWYNELHEEQSEEAWESLHRSCRRQGMPFNLLIGDCNPAAPTHFANQRCIPQDGAEPKARRLVARLWHNPIAFDWDKFQAGLDRGEDAEALSQECWKDWGRKYVARMGVGTSGVTFRRLVQGIWCSAAGAVLDTWDPEIHTISARLERCGEGRFWLIVPEWGDRKREIIRMVGSQDWGYSPNPGVAQVWGIDREGRIYMLCEVYRTRRTPAWWARTWAKLWRRYPLLEAIVCDHEPGMIEDVNSAIRQTQDRLGVHPDRQLGSMARRWSKLSKEQEEKAGLGELRNRLERRPDGTRGLYVLRGNLLGARDPELYDKHLPWCTVMELPDIVYETYPDGKQNKERILKLNDHGFDAMRGLCTYLRDRTEPERLPRKVFPEGSVNALIPGFEDEWVEEGFDEYFAN